MGMRPALAKAQDFSGLFYRRESFWAFVKMQALAVFLFTLVAWGPWVWRIWFVDQSGEIDRWLVAPQVRLLLFFSTTLAEKWPGPVSGGVLSDQHRLLLGLLYGGIGWVAGWIVFQIHEWWALRVVWLAVSFLIWLTFFYGFTFLFFFAVDSTGRLLATM